MKLHSSTAAFCSSAILAASAQSQTEKPLMFAYDQTGAWVSVLPNPQFEPDRQYWTVMVHVRADLGPVAAAAAVCTQIRQRLFLDSNKTLEHGKIAIIIQDFGEVPTGQTPGHPCNFFAVQDGFRAEAELPAPDGWTWPDPDDDLANRNPDRNPWMVQGALDCQDWMRQFLEAYDAWWVTAANIAPIIAIYGNTWERPIPTEWHFDIEFVITNLGTENWSYLF